ncbi:hypothetical protein [Aquimarina algiphila]|uniref:hypothetical protein n=1 Tax=Aquimarina algiphila TaxID=2047982 RepID=UPI0014313359|nr:hypothetical protein [Aquimarina algiphila]
MKKILVLSAIVFGMSLVSSCEATDLNEEIYESELQLTDPGDDGTIDPGEDDRY